MYIVLREGVPFNIKNFLCNIVGQVNKNEVFLHKHDYDVSSNRNNINMYRKSKDYNSFGKTRKINF